MSAVWKYFTKEDKNKQIARCMKCQRLISCSRSSTTALIRHIRSIHKIDLNAPSSSENVDTELTTTNLGTQNEKDMELEGILDNISSLAKSSGSSTEVARKQADSIRMLAECSTANIAMMRSVSESIRSVNDAINANVDALKNLTNVINRISGNMPSLLGKRKRPETVKAHTTLTGANNAESSTSQPEFFNDSTQQIPFIIKSEKDC